MMSTSHHETAAVEKFELGFNTINLANMRDNEVI